MTNPHKGEVEIEVGEARYRLRFSIDAICHLEEATGMSFALLAVKLSNPATQSVSLVRQVLHAGLSEAHPEIDLKAAGELIVPAGGVAAVMEKFNRAVELAFPEVKAAAAPPPKGPRQRSGTGRPS